MTNFIITAFSSMRETIAVCAAGAALLVLTMPALSEGHPLASSIAALSAISSVIADLGSF